MTHTSCTYISDIFSTHRWIHIQACTRKFKREMIIDRNDHINLYTGRRMFFLYSPFVVLQFNYCISLNCKFFGPTSPCNFDHFCSECATWLFYLLLSQIKVWITSTLTVVVRDDQLLFDQDIKIKDATPEFSYYSPSLLFWIYQ